MKKNLFLLGSTGSIGQSTLKVVKNNKTKIQITLLTTNKNIKKLYNQAVTFNVKNVVIFDHIESSKYQQKFYRKNINVFYNLEDALKKIKKKADVTINAISGIDGLKPTIQIIKYSKTLAIANKESIVCGWKFIKKELNKNNVNFIPLDSEHFSIWSLIKNENNQNIKKIYLTASGGPFLNKKLSSIKNVKPKFALKHPNWKMGKKISIDSATMMNKIFEVIEAKKIFNLNINKFDILIHPKSYIHAIVHFKKGLTKLLAHDTTMEIPILNVLCGENEKFNFKDKDLNLSKLNGKNFFKPNQRNFPLLKILKYNFNDTFFEIILISINDYLVKSYINNRISYISLHKQMIKLLKKPYFTKYYKISPKNINEIKSMVDKVNNYLKINKFID